MNVTIENYEEWALDYLEGNLNHYQKELFEDFLKDHPDLQAELQGIDQIRLYPDESIEYPNKSSLYNTRRPIVIPWFGLRYPVAAAIAFLLIMGAGYFIWKGAFPATSPVVQDLTESSSHLPQSGIPVPETDISATNHQTAGHNENLDDSSSQVVSGKLQTAIALKSTDRIHPNNQKSIGEKHQAVSFLGDKSEENPDTESIHPIQTLATPSMEIPDMDYLERKSQAVAMLPIPEGMVTTAANPPIPLHISRMEPSPREFRVHIPGEFLSETWTNINVASLKHQFIPTFITKKLNLEL